MPNIDLSILNQRQTPSFYASSLATRPAFGFAGRIFIDTDSPSTGLYRDTGAAWVQIADPGAGTTGTLQQVTTNGNTTNQGITITAGGLSSNIVNIAANGLGSTANYIGQTMATNDNWKIFGTGSTADVGEMVFQVGDNGSSYASGNGERFRFSYDASSTGTARDSFIIDYDTSYFNTSVGINTPTPGAAIDVHSSANIIGQLNQTVATNNSLLAFQNSGAGLWRIGNFYNGGANDLGIFDVIGNIQPVTVKKTSGQVLIGTSNVGSGKLVVASATGDNGIQIVGASAPSLRIDNAESGPTKRAGFGISTATNNFIQGSADRDFCMFNGSTTASPILFGIYGTTNVQEAARISAARNLLVGTSTDGGFRLSVNGTTNLSNTVTIGPLGLSVPGLQISGNDQSNTRIRITNTLGSSFSVVTGSPGLSNDGFAIYDETAAATRLYFFTSGAATFYGKLGINGGASGAFHSLGIIGNTMSTDDAQIGWLTSFGNAPTNYIDGSQANNRIRFIVNNSIAASFVSTGNLLIGTTTDAGQKLQVNGNATFKGLQSIDASNTYALSVGGQGASPNLVAIGTNSSVPAIQGYNSSFSTVQPISLNHAGGNVLIGTSTNGASKLRIVGLPTSAVGLSSGDVYSNAGILTIVP